MVCCPRLPGTQANSLISLLWWGLGLQEAVQSAGTLIALRPPNSSKAAAEAPASESWSPGLLSQMVPGSHPSAGTLRLLRKQEQPVQEPPRLWKSLFLSLKR